MSILAHYEILKTLGQGGMGVVSLARDTRLGRLVALKQLKPEFCCDRELRERLLAEARAASALNHPNIVTIYDIDTTGDTAVIAMEYVKGRRLDEMSRRQPMPVAEVLNYAIQIARALDAAHRAGIVHRDIKPGNIMVSETGLVKILDFGLAELHRQQSLGPGVIAETVTARTPVGLSGTIFYMSPEQADGREVDSRTDIFAFGCVLYEMLAGRRAFQGDRAAPVLAAILRDEPQSLGELVPGLPPELERVVRRCLRKDPNRRWQQMGDLRIALEELRDEGLVPTVAPEASSLVGGGATRRWLVAGAAALSLAAGLAWWSATRSTSPSPGQPALTRLTSDSGLTSFPSVSPDGTLVAYASDRAGEGNLDVWLQQLAGGEPIRLTHGKADEYEPVFSRDGSRIAFRSEADGGGLYMVSALGGEPRRLVAAGRAACFSPDGNSLVFAISSPGVGGAFTTGASAIYTVNVNGGEPRRLAADFFSALHPQWSADGSRIFFLGTKLERPPTFDLWAIPSAGNAAPVAMNLTAKLAAQGIVSNPEPFAVHGDSLVFPLRNGDTGNLWRARLAPGEPALAGAVEQITFGTGLERLPSVARNGRLVFSAGQENTDLWELPLDADRGEVKGPPRQLTHDTAEEWYPSLSGDGSRLAFISRRGGNADVWTLDMANGKSSQLLSTPAPEFYPKLNHDGTLAAFGVFTGKIASAYLMAVSSGVATRLCEDCGMVRELSSDGSKILMQMGPPAHIELLDTTTRRFAPVYLHPKFQIYAPKLSADAKWTAFQMVEEPTTRTLYVAPFRTGGLVSHDEWIKVSNGRFMDRNPVWSPDGGLLYFLSERDTFRCIWAQRLHPATRQPLGEPFPVAHFHEAVRNLMNIDGPGQIGVSVGPGRLVYTAGELKSNIWFTQLR